MLCCQGKGEVLLRFYSSSVLVLGGGLEGSDTSQSR